MLLPPLRRSHALCNLQQKAARRVTQGNCFDGFRVSLLPLYYAQSVPEEFRTDCTFCAVDFRIYCFCDILWTIDSFYFPL